MSEATSPRDAVERSESSSQQRHLAVVPPAVSAEEPPLDEPRVGRSAAIGAVIGFLAGACLVAIGCALDGLDIGSSIGLGVFVGMWGGAGFGFMVGGTIPMARHADAVSAAERARRETA
jgi:hypothetical protein